MDTIFKIKEFAEKELEIVNDTIIDLAKSKVSDLIPQISEYLIGSGGKRIRPLLTLFISRKMNIQDDADILLATAVEFIHTATLLHDDVIDETTMRRGVKTANSIFGNKSCILVGDFLFSQAFKMMVKTGSIKALNVLSDAAATISEGEVWQLDKCGNINLTEDEYIEICKSKTAVLFAAACATGGIAANCKEEVVTNIFNYGLNLGIAFQIIDDILDYTSDNPDFGKERGSDFLEGKMTLPLIYSYARATNSDRESIKDCFERKNINGIMDWINKYDGFEYSKSRAKDFINIAISSIKAEYNLNELIELAKESLLREK